MEHVLVVGGGFRGIVASHFLLRAGHRVTLAEGAPFLGGVMSSVAWNGYYLDKGCHLFSNDERQVTDTLLELLGGDIVPVQVRYANVTAGQLSDGFAIPDLTVLGPETCARMVYETIEAASGREGQAGTAEEALLARFGPTAARHLAGAMTKMLRAQADNLDAAVIWTANMGRIRILSDGSTKLLKELPALEARLAGRSQENPFLFAPGGRGVLPFRNFYPAHDGMHGFCSAAERRLTAGGVEIHLGARVEALSQNGFKVRAKLSNGFESEFDKVFWTADMGGLSALLFKENPFEGLVHKVPMVLYYFEVPEDRVGPYTYIHDFTPSHLMFRFSSAGQYSHQVKGDGSTYVCCEATTEMDSDIWQDPEGHAEVIWREAAALGAVKGSMPASRHILKTPVSYKVGRPGHSAAARALLEKTENLTPRIVLDAEGAFYRNDIQRSLRRLVETHECAAAVTSAP